MLFIHCGDCHDNIVRVSAVQLPAFPQGKTFAETTARKTSARYGSRSPRRGSAASDLVLFGEYANLSHRTWSDNRREYLPEPVPGPLTRIIGAEAKRYRMNVAFPLFGTWKGELSSYVVLFDRKGNDHGVLPESAPHGRGTARGDTPRQGSPRV